MDKVILITGSNSGLGRALAQKVLNRGARTVLAVRDLQSVDDMVRKYPGKALPLRLDVTNETDRSKLIDTVMEKFGCIDVLVNNAGQGSLGAFEEFSSQQIRRQFEVNTFGVMEMTKGVLPVMRRRRSGHIINVTSVGGVASMGGFALYCATKFAVEGFSEGLRDEVAPLGIHVTIVEPGAFRTRFAGKANMRPEAAIDDYRPVVEPVRQYLYGSHGKQPGDPHKAAEAIIRIMTTEKPPLRLMLGRDAYEMWEKKSADMEQDLAKWRGLGETTAFDNATITPIGGQQSL